MLLRTLTAIVSISILAAAPVGCKKKKEGGESGQAAQKPAGGGAGAEAGQKTFMTLCVGCHSVGQGDRTGPDLKGVTERRERDWLVKWIKDPIGMGQNDPIGKELFAKYNNVPMPPQPLNDQQIGEILDWLGDPNATTQPAGGEVKVAEADFEKAKGIYFDRCAGCHGALRAGATGPNITPENTKKRGTESLKVVLREGLAGGMPAWGKLGILSEEEVDLMARYVQLDPPQPPPRDLDAVKASWKEIVPLADRPTKFMGKGDWQNYFGVVLRDAGQVAVIDGDTKEKLAIIETGFAVHILRSSSSGRYFYAVGRDGRVSMIDLWAETPNLVAQVQGCSDARSVDASKYKGYEDKLVIEGCYWPPQYVVMDGQTLEPKHVENVLTPAFDTNEELKEVRVASIVASEFAPIWVINLKESGHVALVDYSKENFPMVAKIGAERFLHDGGWDRTGRYFMVAANMRNQMVVVDVKDQKLVTKFETGNKPHPGRGANFKDPEYGWVNVTSHIGEGKLAIYGADPKGKPDSAWKVVRSIETDSPGSLFVKTHEKSDWVWYDSPLSNVPEKTRQICVYSKKEGKTSKCWTPFESGRAVHFEYNKAGTEVWVSGWDKKGQIVVYDDKTLEEKQRIQGDWLVTPTGKFNVYNTANDIY